MTPPEQGMALSDAVPVAEAPAEQSFGSFSELHSIPKGTDTGISVSWRASEPSREIRWTSEKLKGWVAPILQEKDHLKKLGPRGEFHTYRCSRRGALNWHPTMAGEKRADNFLALTVEPKLHLANGGMTLSGIGHSLKLGAKVGLFRQLGSNSAARMKIAASTDAVVSHTPDISVRGRPGYVEKEALGKLELLLWQESAARQRVSLGIEDRWVKEVAHRGAVKEVFAGHHPEVYVKFRDSDGNRIRLGLNHKLQPSIGITINSIPFKRSE